MAINLDERYPGRANPKTLSYPQGSFKNRTSPTSKDGTYLEQDWANDFLGFFQRMMVDAGLTANGQVDTAESSQYFDAMIQAVGNRFPKYATFAEISALTEDQGPLICNDNHAILYLWDGETEAYKPVSATESKAGTVRFSTTEQAQDLLDDDVAVTPKKLGDAMNSHVLGMGQTWQVYSEQRAFNTNYTNTTGRPIFVSVYSDTSMTGDKSLTLRVNGLAVGRSDTISNNDAQISAIVPSGDVYRVDNVGYSLGVQVHWVELR